MVRLSYLLIENAGEAELASLTLMGASTKRSQTDKIGLFGTGNKYALSVLLREGLEVTMFLGNKQVTFEMEDVHLRGEKFRQIILKHEGQSFPTGFTVEMGIKWKAENALREFISNAIDEGEFMIAEWDGDIRPLAGRTRIFVKMTPAIKTFYESRGGHFLALRQDKPLYRVSSPDVELWPRLTAKARFYRRGVLVYEDSKHEGLFDYNFGDIELAEDRTASESNCQWKWAESVDKFPLGAKKVVIENIERDTFESHNPYMQYHSLSSEEWKEAVGEKIVCSVEVYDHALAGEVPREAFVRTTAHWSTALKSAGCRDVRDFLSKSALRGHKEISLEDFELDELLAAVAFLKSADIEITLADVKVFDTPTGADANTMGYWDEKAKMIYISKACFIRGRRYIAEVLLEEAMHRDSGMDDKTRGFQSYLFTKIVNEMEKRIGSIEIKINTQTP